LTRAGLQIQQQSQDLPVLRLTQNLIDRSQTLQPQKSEKLVTVSEKPSFVRKTSRLKEEISLNPSQQSLSYKVCRVFIQNPRRRMQASKLTGYEGFLDELQPSKIKSSKVFLQ
jgi:hypothetical protein